MDKNKRKTMEFYVSSEVIKIDVLNFFNIDKK